MVDSPSSTGKMISFANNFRAKLQREKMNKMESDGPSKMSYDSVLSKAREHLDKETQRGKNSPKIEGYKTGHHGGRVEE